MAKMQKQEKRKVTRREFYGYEGNKRDTMDYVFWILCVITVLVTVAALLLYVL